MLLAACAPDPAPAPAPEAGAGPPAAQDAQAAPAAKDGTAPLLWRVPDTPGPFAVEVDGIMVDPEVVRAYLDQPWADFYSARYLALEQTPELQAQAEREFSADVPALFEGLVRGVLFLREAERRYPALDEREIHEFREGMQAEAGGAYLVLQKKLGEDGLRAHIERQLRLRKLEAELADAQPPVTQEQVMAEYERVLGEMSPDEAGNQLTFQEAAPLVRATLEQNRRADAGNAWADAHRPGVKVRVTRPNGVVVEF